MTIYQKMKKEKKYLFLVGMFTSKGDSIQSNLVYYDSRTGDNMLISMIKGEDIGNHSLSMKHPETGLNYGLRHFITADSRDAFLQKLIDGGYPADQLFHVTVAGTYVKDKSGNRKLKLHTEVIPLGIGKEIGFMAQMKSNGKNKREKV